MATIDELLNALQDPNMENSKLANDYNTWRRIGNKDDFSELGISKDDLDEFLRDWIEENPYSNI